MKFDLDLIERDARSAAEQNRCYANPAEVAELAAYAKRLRAALERYGKHEDHCNAFGAVPMACCCGLDEALRGPLHATNDATKGGGDV